MTSPRISLRDARLIERLERAFSAHAGADSVIDAAELQRALGLRSEYLAGRVLAGFDTDGNGRIDRAEFLSAVHKLVYGNEREKLEFAFRLHDGDGDGFIGRTDLLRMIFIGLAEDELVTDEAEPERLAAALWAHADTDRDGRISFDEFVNAIRRRPTLLASMTRNEAAWISPNEALLDRLSALPRTRSERFSRFVQNRAREIGVCALVLVANLLVFGFAFRALPLAPSEALAMRLARAFGRTFALDFGLLFVTVMRRALTRLRPSALGRVIPVDRALDAHRALGHAALVLALAHAGAAIAARARGHASASIAGYLLGSVRGLSGFALVLLFLLIWVCAQPFIRRSQRFELFYFTHLSYLPFAVLSIVHAPAVLLFAALPLAGFAIEHLPRLRMRGTRVAILAVEALRSGVTRIELERPPEFRAQATDYVYLNLPQLARHEWHPFTISSAPERDRLVLHVRSLGNFTEALRRWAIARNESGGELGTAQLDGPYGTESARILAGRHVVLIGAGIGVTPFASVLESVALRSQDSSADVSALERVHFFWLNRDQYSFEWFTELLTQLVQIDRGKLLDLHIFMTGGRSGATAAGLELARRARHAQGGSDVVTGLSLLTRMGHPDWPSVLAEIAEQHAPARVEVFFCGPHGLGKKLAPICERLEMSFHEEQF